MSDCVPYARQEVTQADIDAVMGVLRSPWLTTGPALAAFEVAVAERVDARHAVGFSSGTAALHAAAAACGIGPGDEGIVSPLTFCATANCLVYRQAKPVFADVSAGDLNLDVSAAKRRMTKRTKAILPVDYAGHPAGLDAVMGLADKYGLTVIEDACHALGARFKGKTVGGISHMTVFSFHPVKHITTGEGGMVTTNDACLAKRLRAFRNHGIDREFGRRQAQNRWDYDVQSLGFNYRLSELGAALGLSQLNRLDENLSRRRRIAARYIQALADIPEIILPQTSPAVEHAWHLFPVRLKSGRTAVFKALREEGIGVNVHYRPVYDFALYRRLFGSQTGSCPEAEKAYASLISLPMFHAMTDEETDRVIAAVRKVIAAHAGTAGGAAAKRSRQYAHS